MEYEAVAGFTWLTDTVTSLAFHKTQKFLEVDSSNHSPNLVCSSYLREYKFLFVAAVPTYFNFATFSKYLWLRLAILNKCQFFHVHEAAHSSLQFNGNPQGS